MRLPTLTAPARLVVASLVGAIALGGSPGIGSRQNLGAVDANSVAAQIDVGSQTGAIGSLPLQRVPDEDLYPAVLGPSTSISTSVTAQQPTRPPWWNPSIPRVDAITQLDNGPFQNVNCVMASGAMLAHLAYGIETTGSQLRALQDDVDGGTSLDDLQTAIGRGWHVRFSTGALTALQLRKVLYAGAGAVIIGNYGELPEATRLSATFTGSHAVYVDAFRPSARGTSAAYYVIDPLGNPAAGYRGDWWPAEVVERFAASFGGGLVDSAWAFAHGDVPVDHPILPRTAYPTGPPTWSQTGSASSTPSGGTDSTDAGPSESASPTPGHEPVASTVPSPIDWPSSPTPTSGPSTLPPPATPAPGIPTPPAPNGTAPGTSPLPSIVPVPSPAPSASTQPSPDASTPVPTTCPPASSPSLLPSPTTPASPAEASASPTAPIDGTCAALALPAASAAP